MSSLPYTPLYRAGEWACISGQIGMDDRGVVDGFEAQLRQIFANLERLLADDGVDRTQIARITVFLADMADYATLNEVYLEWFGDHRPARTAIAVKELPFGALVELEGWAYLGT